MKGGKAIATGADGCVFDGTFESDGTFEQSTGEVTKVYAPQYATVAANEYARMQEVRAATQGVGVLVATTPPVTIDKIPDEAWDNPPIKGVGACKLVAESPGPYTGLELPRIVGDFATLRRTVRPMLSDESFEALNTAIARMHHANLVHMDFANRNIFYTSEGTGDIRALLGDFGATINLNSPDFDTQIQAYITRYRLRNRFLASVKVDGLDPVALAMMIAYDTLLQGKSAYDAFLAEVASKNYAQQVNVIAQNTWVVKYISAYSDGNWEVDGFAEDMADEYRKILTLFASPGKTYETMLPLKDGIADTLKHRLARSDVKLFTLFVGTNTMRVLDEDACLVIRNAWFKGILPTIDPAAASAPAPAPVDDAPRGSQAGGRRMRGGIKPETLEFNTLDEAFAVPDLVLPNTAGRRKTHRKKRARRVKMSRRR
jgi:hypothetical protein